MLDLREEQSDTHRSQTAAAGTAVSMETPWKQPHPSACIPNQPASRPTPSLPAWAPSPPAVGPRGGWPPWTWPASARRAAAACPDPALLWHDPFAHHFSRQRLTPARVCVHGTQGQPRCCLQTAVENAGDAHPATPKPELNAPVSPPAWRSRAPALKWALSGKRQRKQRRRCTPGGVT